MYIYVTFCFFVFFQPESEFPIIFLSQGAPHPESTPLIFQKKRTKQDTKSSMDSIVGTIACAFNVNYCRLGIYFLAAV